MKSKISISAVSINPDEQKLTKIQSKRLSDLSGIDVSSVKGSIAQIAETLKWKIDPTLFLFRKVCGRVVKKDSVTGVEYPVPFATVYVEDTDCNLISYFPKGWQWVWHFPFNCRREVIAQTKTDACGNFCVWIPRFDIDWVIKWRKERLCFPTIFQRPQLNDFIPHIPELIEKPRLPIPLPDPGPLFSALQSVSPIARESIASRSSLLAQKIKIQAPSELGSRNIEDRSLKTRAFESEMQPPLPKEFLELMIGQNVVAAKGTSPMEAIKSIVANEAGTTVKELGDFHPQRFIGPFYRCIDVLVPTWQHIVDAPDITFRVGQDIDGDGTEETIYSESYFDVRWDSSDSQDVTLVANDQAKASSVCNAPVVPCGNVPAILFAGFLPLTLPAYYDNVNGYALRTNRPKLGSLRPDAQTPFCRNVQLYGCVDIQNAKHYRLMHSVDGGLSFSPITGVAWNNYKNTGGAPIVIQADASGWYLVNPVDSNGNTVARSTLEFANLLIDWPTPYLGKQILKLEIADGSKNHIADSALITMQTDNSAPTIGVNQLAWKFVGENDSALRSLLNVPCPTIHRGASPREIELVLSVNVSAAHLRDAYLATEGCGGAGGFMAVGAVASHWHTNVLDNTIMLNQRYTLSTSNLEGAYSFTCTAHSRAINPAGSQGENNVPPDWLTDRVYIYNHQEVRIAVVNVD